MKLWPQHVEHDVRHSWERIRAAQLGGRPTILHDTRCLTKVSGRPINGYEDIRRDRCRWRREIEIKIVDR